MTNIGGKDGAANIGERVSDQYFGGGEGDKVVDGFIPCQRGHHAPV